jgi:type IV pilus assembly protein PilM
MPDFLTLKPEAFGLDISDLSLKIIRLKKKGNFFDLASFGEQEVTPGIVKEGEIKKEEDLVNIIKNALSKVEGEPIRTNYVISSLPEEKAFLQVIRMPRMSEEDLKSAVIYEAENYIPLPIEDVYLDFQIVTPVDHLKELEVLIAALPKKIVDPYISCLKKAGLVPLSLEIESLAIARALIKDEVTTSPVLLIDLGATRTSFVVFSGRSVRFTSSIPVSGQIFTKVISKALSINLAKAEKLKIEQGLEKKEEKIFEVLIPPLTDLVQQIKRCISYYQTHASIEHLPTKRKGITKVLLCGGGANLKGLCKFLFKKLKMPVEIGNPWVNILPESKKEKPELPLEKALGYTTSLGLALRGIKTK